MKVVPGHKRAPSDTSMASSEDEKLSETTSTLDSVTEKTEPETAEDKASDKLSDEGLGTSVGDRAEVEKLNEVSDASNEDLVDGQVKPMEPKPEESPAGKPEEIPDCQITIVPEAPSDTQESVIVSEETGEEEKVEDGPPQVFPKERVEVEEKKTEEEEVKKEPIKEEPEVILQPPTKFTDPGDQPRSALEEPGAVLTEVNAKPEETEKETLVEEMTEEVKPEADGVTDINTDTDLNEDTDNTESDVNTDAEVDAAEGSTEVSADTEAQRDNNVIPVVILEEGTTDEREEKPPAEEAPSQDAVSESKTDQESTPVKSKPDVEKDSDSGSSSAADSNSMDLNLSISSFLSKKAEAGSVSIQVTRRKDQ